MRQRGGWKKGRPDMSDTDYMAKLKRQCTVTDAGCWEIGGFHFASESQYNEGKGYGAMCYRGKNWRANRLAYFLWKGPIPPGQIIRHTCDNPPCCNPDHLVAGTHRENIRDCIARGRQRFHPSHKTHCVRGHAFDEANTALHTDPRGYIFRRCRQCGRERYQREKRPTSDRKSEQ